jgi:hypothetical protein
VQLPPNSGSANSRVCRVHGTITAICCKGFKALVLHFAARCVIIYNIVPHTLSVRITKAQSHNQGPSKTPHTPSVPCMHVYIARHQGPRAHRYKCVMQSTSVCDEPIRIGSFALNSRAPSTFRLNHVHLIRSCSVIRAIIRGNFVSENIPRVIAGRSRTTWKAWPQ